MSSKEQGEVPAPCCFLWRMTGVGHAVAVFRYAVTVRCEKPFLCWCGVAWQARVFCLMSARMGCLLRDFLLMRKTRFSRGFSKLLIFSGLFPPYNAFGSAESTVLHCRTGFSAPSKRLFRAVIRHVPRHETGFAVSRKARLGVSGVG